ncbi:MAG: pyridoxamine 5'-phosphate oxidase family protein [Dehalococcoidia bacterium]|nr:pyridoxamine 5'-phosphate oxidase family protein [Dehalococcoidia bacterium]
MYVVSDELRGLIESGVAVSIATADAAGHPHLNTAWGPRIGAGGTTATVFIDRARSATTTADLHSTRWIAMTIGDPISYRSIQLKGTQLGVSEASEEDREWVRLHREAFMVSIALIDDPPALGRNMWTEDVIRIDFQIEQAFDQTPGPNAGQPL